ncbi:MAG: hypothetical protein HQL23_01965 [Candidatus Omnitrophica bacterium]|nr:hypothetical protein [Candidatus Omnitrophota bacterium]
MKNLFFLLLFLTLMARPASATFLSEVDKVRQFNPDGKKYEFCKDYLNGLSYLANNESAVRLRLSADMQGKSEAEKGKKALASLVQENVNLRVAKNTLKKYLTADNGLMIKVAHIFMQVCDAQIALNSKEHELDEGYLKNGTGPAAKNFDWKKQKSLREQLLAERRESMKGLLEASLLAQKILISDKPDRLGQLVNLGITAGQREKLIFKIKELFGRDTPAHLQEGQSFLKGSVAAILEILEDQTWGTIEARDSVNNN